MPLLIHGEVTTAGVDIFDKEARFIEEVIKVCTCAPAAWWFYLSVSIATSWLALL